MAETSPTSACLELIEQELKAFRRTGRAVHLAHVARAIQELQSAIGHAEVRRIDL